MGNLLEKVRFQRVMNAIAAGTTDQNSSSVDLEDDGGYKGVLFCALFGTLTATQVTSIHGEQSEDDSSFAGLEGTSVGPFADDDDNQMLLLDIYRPAERYVRCVVDRGTANAVIDGVVAISYDGYEAASTQDSSTVAFSEAHVSPAEGTV